MSSQAKERPQRTKPGPKKAHVAPDDKDAPEPEHIDPPPRDAREAPAPNPNGDRKS